MQDILSGGTGSQGMNLSVKATKVYSLRILELFWFMIKLLMLA